MCPDPMKMTEVMIAVVGTILVSDFVLVGEIPTIALGAWILVMMLYYLFAPQHCVFCGVPMFFPSRWHQFWYKPTPEEIAQAHETMKRWNDAMDDLKSKGCISEERTLHDLMPDMFGKREL